MLLRFGRKSSKKPVLCRDLTARQKSEEYRVYFRLPQSEIIDGTIKGEFQKRNFNLKQFIWLKC